MSTNRGKPRPKAYLSIGEYLRKAGAFKTVNVYYNDIVSTHPSVALSENGDDEDVDELTQGMIDAAQHGHLETLRILANKAQTGGEEGGLGTCIGERVACLMLHLAAEHGHDAIVHCLVEDLWVDIDAGTVRGMTALHYAAKANRTAVIRELARLGADLEARNDCGQVPAQLTKDRLLQRLFQQYLGGGALGTAPMIDRFVPPSATRVVDYVAVMTVTLAPQLQAYSDKISRVRQASVSELWRFPPEDHEDTPMADAPNLAEICTQNCHSESGPLPAYGTLLTDMSGRRSHVLSKVLGVYQDSAQRGRARIHTALTAPSDAVTAASTAAGELTARVVLLLARHPYPAAFKSACEHVAELILEEVPKWSSLERWPMDFEHERNAQIKFALKYYATEMPLPLPSREIEFEVLGRALKYGDPHAAHSSFPLLEQEDLSRLTSRLGPDAILTALTCLLQEQSVLILSERWEDLSPVISTLLGLLFPMRWPHTVIPVLPASLVHYLEAPVPFLMGMHVAGLDRVGADLSCTTIVNLTSGKVVLPIRPITSVSTVPLKGDGKEPQRRPSRRDSTTRSLAEIPIALRRQAERRIRQCVPLESAPLADRIKNRQQPRASSLYTPGLRVAVVDVLVGLVGGYQTYRYQPGAQERMISEAPEDYRKILEAIFSTQLWSIFREDLLAEEGTERSGPWEAQVQLFCACVERARHQDGLATFKPGESHSCQDVLYPSEDIEVQLSLLSVYPTPECLAETDDEAEESDMDTETETNGLGGAGEGAAQGELSLQRKTDEVLKSITSSFAAVTDMFAPKDDDSSSSLSPRRPTVRGGRGSAQEQDDAAGKGGKAATTFNRTGWDLFKGQSMTEIKRRFEGAGLSVSPARNTQSNNAINTGSSSTSTTPTGGGFGMFGDSFRDFRRRSHEAVTEAVTKLKSALDEGDDVGPTWTDKKSTRNTSGALTATESDRIRAAARAGRAASAPSTEDDSFWRPFGDVTRADETPVPLPDTLGGGGLSLPSALKSSRLKTNSLSPSAQKSASDRLKAYYGAASP